MRSPRSFTDGRPGIGAGRAAGAPAGVAERAPQAAPGASRHSGPGGVGACPHRHQHLRWMGGAHLATAL